MLAEKGFRGKAEMQIANGNDFESIIVKRHAHRSAAD